MAVGNVALISPHADDETLSKGYAGTWYARAGFNLHTLLMSRSGVTAASLRLDGSLQCKWGEHPYMHQPAVEGYTLPTPDEIGLARWNEFRAATYQMTTIDPAPGVAATGQVFHYEGGLGVNWGCDGCGSSTAPVTRAGVDAAKAVIMDFVSGLPANTHIRTMSPTDHHPDHAACGIACYELKFDPAWATRMGDLMFFASRLYWGNGTTIPRDPALAAETCTWFPADTGLGAGNSIYNAICDHLRNKVQKAYTAWSPPGAWAVGGGHSVPDQFAKNFAPGVSISNLWHPATPGKSYPVVP